MPVIEATRLSLAAFHARYEGEKPYYEFWDGEAVQKSMPTSLHGLIQAILLRLLYGLGYDARPEITLRIDPAYEFIPDVIAIEGAMERPYPTKAFEVAIEILSPSDPFSRVQRKCVLYEKWGIRQIVIIDPEERIVWRFANGSSAATDTIATRGESRIAAEALWQEVDRLEG